MPSCYERSATFASLLIVRDGYCLIDVARWMLLALLPTFNTGTDPSRPLAAN